MKFLKLKKGFTDRDVNHIKPTDENRL